MNASKKGQVHTIVRGPITTTQLVMYAGASGDFNRIHFDQPYALEAGLDGVLAHGMLTMALAANCALGAVGPDSMIKRIGARFVAPVKVGDMVSITGAIVSERENEAEVELEARVMETVVLRGSATVAWI